MRALEMIMLEASYRRSPFRLGLLPFCAVLSSGALLFATVTACGSEGDGEDAMNTDGLSPTGAPSDAPAPQDSAPAGDPPGPTPLQSSPTPAGPDDLLPDNEPEAVPVADDPEADVEECASESSAAELKPVVLAFAFDVSPSMGRGDGPDHDPDLKWRPVVAATKVFFENPDSGGVSATLTFFPADVDGQANGPKCQAETYFDPDVMLTQLPSTAFGEAIDAIDPLLNNTDWPGGGGTPTSGALQGIVDALSEMQAADAEPTYAVVLVTDGYPTDCGDVDGEDRNAIAYVASIAASVANSIPTYVVGVDSPAYYGEMSESSLSNLNEIAAAGGTDTAFIVSTGDPEQTVAEFQAAVEDIRGRAFSCSVTIPEPPTGQSFDDEKVNVDYTSGGVTTRLVYSPDCSEANAWHYNDETNPTQIDLCQDACDLLSQDPLTQLDVAFGCERIERPAGAR